MDFEEMLFLKESYNETLDNYNMVIDKKRKYSWDWIIITASNEMQAQSYNTQLKYRKDQGLLPEIRIDILPDDNGERIGSGGATLNVLKFLSENDPDWLNKKILLIHSGGDSKRLPQYSACGKLFSHVPRSLIDNRPSTLFDEFMVTLSLVPERLNNGMLVVCGDVLLLFNYLQIDIHNEDAIAISMKSPVKIGKEHGVFLSNNKGKLEKFLHKKNIEELTKIGAVDNNGDVDIDTGLIWISSKIENDLLSLIKKNDNIDESLRIKYVNSKNRLSFYGDLLYPFSINSNLEEYLSSKSEGIYDENLKECRINIWNKLNKYELNIIKTSPSKFIHVGTTQELIELNTMAQKNYSFLNWKNNILTNSNQEDISIINSLFKKNVVVKNDTFIEDSILEEANIGRNCVISGASFHGKLDDNMVLHILPIIIDNNKFFVARLYGTTDNPKDDLLFGEKLIEILKKNNIIENTIWDTEDRTLWEANLYTVCKTEREAIAAYELFIGIIKGTESKSNINKWVNSRRLSLAKSFTLADIEKIIERQNDIDYKVRSNLIIDKFNNGGSAEDCCEYINRKNVKNIISILVKKRQDTDYKLDSLLSYIMDKYNDLFESQSLEMENDCYRKIKNSMLYKKNRYKINKPINDVIVKNPVRINFGGGWSDTPPHCIENGGTVLNAAIDIDGELPIVVEVKKNKKNEFKFKSNDLNLETKYNEIEDIKKLDEVGDPFILSKAALICLNIFDNEYLEEFGIEIITSVNVPIGSGLGTSSILAGTIVLALSKFYSIKIDSSDIFNVILEIEQLISTGGGWQDQIGGIVPGIKLIETNKGQKQEYKITPINNSINIKELEDRMLLIYTGQKRIAKNLLRKIMNKYIRNDEDTKKILKKIQHMALMMKFELEKGTIDDFASLLTEHFNLIKHIDSGITNVCIDHIISSFDELVSGYTIAGAGGGGFLYIILKKGVSKDQLRKRINSVYKENGIKVFNCSFVNNNDIC